jgi:hypothetical protein
LLPRIPLLPSSCGRLIFLILVLLHFFILLILFFLNDFFVFLGSLSGLSLNWRLLLRGFLLYLNRFFLFLFFWFL